MSTYAPPAWWDDSMRGTLVGFATSRGHSRSHIVRVGLLGPGAVTRRAACGGIQGTVLVNTAVDVNDEAAARALHRTGVIWDRRPGQVEYDEFRATKFQLPLCDRCKEWVARGLQT